MKKNLFALIFVVLFIGFTPGKATAQEAFITEVKLFTGNFAPRGWAFCEGQLLAISQHQTLFSLIGTIYGGDGRTTFALPDLRGRIPVGVGNGPGLSSMTVGQKTGAESATLRNEQLPAHHHGLINVEEVNIKTSPANNNNNNNNESKKVLAPAAGGTATIVTTQNTGGSQSINIKQPSLGMHYIICINGIFPSRS